MTGHELLLHQPTEYELAAKDDIIVGYDLRIRPVAPSAFIPARGISWVARILGRNARYRWGREFLRRRGEEFVAEPGIYEMYRADLSRRYVLVGADGVVREIEEADVEAILELGG